MKLRLPVSLRRVKLPAATRLNAFTLTELLIVLVIIGILVLLALPALMPLISRTRSVEAKQMLTHLQALEKTYFFEHAKYTGSLDDIGFEQEKLSTENGKANYRIEITSSAPTQFSARATSVVDFDGDGTFNVWEIDQDKNLVEVIKD
jgi:type IV pilus assembly protein PilE